MPYIEKNTFFLFNHSFMSHSQIKNPVLQTFEMGIIQYINPANYVLHIKRKADHCRKLMQAKSSNVDNAAGADHKGGVEHVGELVFFDNHFFIYFFFY